MNYLSQLKSKRIVVLGLGLTGMSFVRFLTGQNIPFSVNDSREHLADRAAFETGEISTLEAVFGSWSESLISSADILLVSPGIDLATSGIEALISKGCEVLGDVELFCRLSNLPMVAVTGSNGKSTVVTLVDHIGKALGVNTQLGGNIGVPVLDTLAQAPEALVLELSSFQLETMTSMKAVAATVLNVSDDHLDRHKTMANYSQIKQRIYQQCQTAIYNRDDALTAPNLADNHLKSTSIGSNEPQAGEFGLREVDTQLSICLGATPLIAVKHLPIAGMHNALNCMAALALGHSFGWPMDKMIAALPSFIGLSHRCQVVPSDDGITWINDSKATNVGATLAAINGLAPVMTKENKLFLIAGGDSKGADFSPLVTALNDHVDSLITLGKDANALAQLHRNSYYVESIEQAVSKAKQLAVQGDIVLLSPACASIDMFTNYIERGERFIKAQKNEVAHDHC